MSAMRNFLNELRRRRVFRMTAVYIISGWVVLQVADLLFPALEIRDAESPGSDHGNSLILLGLSLFQAPGISLKVAF